ncbi:MAG: MATE family efflux transporter [Chitinophagaceae bacterium]|nr:MATE family efflux transporter [Chitinophagaceae bacterium]
MLFNQAKKTLNLAFPIIIGEVAQLSLGLIDSAMVGAVSYKQLAASALVFSVINIPFVFGIGITISVSQLVSMAHGRSDKKLVSHYLFNGFWLSTVSAILIALLVEFSMPLLFHLDQDPEVAMFAAPYLRVMGWGVIPMLMFMSLKQFTDGLEYTKTAMVMSLAAIPVKVFLNWLIIFGNWGFPRWELYGAGVATLVTRILLFVGLLGVILRHSLFRRYIMIGKRAWIFRWNSIRQLLYIGIPSGFQIAMEAGAFAVSSILVGTLGAVSLAAHQIALSLASFTFMISIGLSQAASIRTSSAFGRRDQPLIGRIGKSTLYVAWIYGGACALLFIIFRHQLPFIFNDNPEVVALATFLILLGALFQISDSSQAIAAGLLRGIKDVRVPTVFIGIAYWVIGLPFGYYLTFKAGLGAAGIWTGFITGLTFSAVLLFIRFRKMVWKNHIKKWDI